MDQSSVAPPLDLASSHQDNKDQAERSQADVNKENHRKSSDSSHNQVDDNTFSRVNERTTRGHPTVDIAEVLRRWTHALQRVHKQSLQLAKANDGEGPELLRSPHDGGTGGHAESLAATLAEHEQHLASIQVLINQLKEVAPSIQNSILELTEEVSNISSNSSGTAKLQVRSHSPVQAQSSGRTLEHSDDEVSEMSSSLSSMQFEKTSASPATLKLPPLFSVTPNSSGKGGAQKRQISAQTSQIENMPERKSLDQQFLKNSFDNPPQDNDTSFVQNLKRSVREAALCSQSYHQGSSQDSRSDDSSEHYFEPVSGFGLSQPGDRANLLRRKKLFVSESDSLFLGTGAPDNHMNIKSDGMPDLLSDLQSVDDYDGFLSIMGSTSSFSDAHRSFYDIEEPQDEVFSPPLLMDASLLADSYEDLLAPLSETETALMEH